MDNFVIQFMGKNGKFFLIFEIQKLIYAGFSDLFTKEIPVLIDKISRWNDFPEIIITLSDVAASYIKGHRRKTWSRGQKCTRPLCTAPYTFGLGNKISAGSHVFDPMTLIFLINQDISAITLLLK